ncbi:protein-cysteine N-palmitoyltransferase HHAT-like protein isoform X2 [Ixodes scapularis]
MGGDSETVDRPVASETQTASPRKGQSPLVAKLLVLDQVFHWLVWIGGVLYALGCFATSSTNVTLPQVVPRDFVDGSYGIWRDKDTADEEWYRYSTAIRRFWHWVLLQPLISQLLFKKIPEFLPHFYFVYSAIFMLYNLTWTTVLVFLASYAAFFAAATVGSIVACYVLALVIVLHSSFPVLGFLKPAYPSDGNVSAFLAQVGLSWTAARCLSFSVDFVRQPERPSAPQLWQTLAYVFYLPSLFTGPLQNYDGFVAQLNKPQVAWTSGELRGSLLQLGRCLLCFLLLEACLHFCYSSALAYYPDLVESLDLPGLLGFGLCLTLVFFLKYRVLYGFGSAVARLERIELPPPPKCVHRIHLCSYLWRHFDRGLYLWIQRYIYQPVVAGQWTLKRRVVGAAASFAFVCSWHGMDRAVIVWCLLNFVGVSTELLAGFLRGRRPWRGIERRYLTGIWLRTARAVVTTPHFLFSIFSCLFFLSNVDVGLIFLRKVVLGFPMPLVPLLFVMYCGCHVSMDAMDWDKTGSADSSKHL